MNSIPLSKDLLCQGKLVVYQPQKGYRFSIDSILLAYFVTLKPRQQALDLGAGCGVISLLLAQKYKKVNFYALEIQKTLLYCLQQNIKINRLSQQIFPVHGDLREPPFKSSFFDVIFSNPPFRSPHTGRLSPYLEERIARHEILASLEDILKTSRYLLKNKGRLFLIYPAYRLATLLSKARKYSLEPKKLQTIHSYPEENASLVLVECLKGGGEEIKILPPLFIYQYPKGPYTSSLRKIFASF